MPTKKHEQIHQEIIEEAMRDTDDGRSFFKHPLIILLLGVALIAMFISTYFVFFPVSKTVEGSFNSALLDSDILRIYDLELHFLNNTAAEITSLYHNEQQAEFSLCLFGKRDGSKYLINSFFQPTQYSRSFSQVVFECCPKETLILFHTHPFKSCLASTQDIETLQESQRENPELLMVIMCEPTRFAVYE